MGKSKTQKPSIMREAANKRAEYRKWLIRLVVGLVICLAAIAVYYFLVINYVIENAPGITWILAAIAAIFGAGSATSSPRRIGPTPATLPSVGSLTRTSSNS